MESLKCFGLKPLRFIHTMKYILITSILLLSTTSLLAQLQRIEPPFWYAGMHNPELQVMFYGKNIAAHEVAVSNSVPINGVVRTENPNYLFVTIDTKGIDKGTDLVFTFSKNGKKAFTQKYELRRREPGSSLRKGFDSSDLIYLIMPDRFANGNPSNDNMPGMLDKADRSKPNSRHGGDIEGIIKSLDYIKGL